MLTSVHGLNRFYFYYRSLSLPGLLAVRADVACPCRVRAPSPYSPSNALQCRPYSSEPIPSKESYFLTTPIFYVNAVPHIGHLHTAVLADAVARWYRIRGYNVIFSTGTDEHGLKIQQAAKLNKVSPQALCDRVSSEFKRLFDAAYISYTDYVRTTEVRHKDAVHKFWRTLEDSGHIYHGQYEGWYSTSDEAFLTDADVIDKDENGEIKKVAKDSGQPVEWIKEDNYMFRLSEFTPKLKEWLDSGVVRPANFEPLVRGWLEGGLPDLSISRHASRLKWGIPVPEDPSQTIYVWLDALVNYLTVAGYPRPGVNGIRWPVDCQVIGKDIIRFHTIYWPAFLLAAGMAPPRQILCHSHWTVDGFKMSKSRGNVVNPFHCLDRYTSDGFRYFLLREAVPHNDGNYSERRVLECVNSELVNSLGNLLSRSTAAAVNKLQLVPSVDLQLFLQKAIPEEKSMLEKLQALPGLVDGHYRDFCPYRGLEAIITQVHETNAFFQRHEPWLLVRDPTQDQWLHTVLAITMETLRISGILLQPVIPNMAARLLDHLNVSEDERTFWDVQTVPLIRKQTNLGVDSGHLMKRIIPEID